MTQPYRRFRNPGDEPPATWTEWELTQRKRDIEACNRQLLDLMREYGAQNWSKSELNKASAIYRQRCELDILPGSDFRPISVGSRDQSYCGSPAAMSAGY